MVRFIIALIIIAAVLMLFGRAGQGYVGGISPGTKTSALPPGYRSEAPNNPYTGN